MAQAAPLSKERVRDSGRETSAEKHRRALRGLSVKLSTCIEAQHALIAGFPFESCGNLLQLGEVRGNRDIDVRLFGESSAMPGTNCHRHWDQAASFIGNSWNDLHQPWRWLIFFIPATGVPLAASDEGLLERTRVPINFPVERPCCFCPLSDIRVFNRTKIAQQRLKKLIPVAFSTEL
ncbi:hypothetical protein [Bradyrhizobium tropiciagri]|uniref:hypothetical protein n=1 Tax=Bradyrhizobium tropiciagri TaxID=312253 RepID=UPI0012FF5355